MEQALRWKEGLIVNQQEFSYDRPFVIFVVAVFFVSTLTGCNLVHNSHHGHLPPGQLKKL